MMVTAPQAPLPHGTCSGEETREYENKKVLINCAAKTPRAARGGEKEVKVGRRDPFFFKKDDLMEGKGVGLRLSGLPAC